MKEILHFAHGNGFPGGSYKQLLSHLEPYYDCVFMDRIGHNKDYPVSDNWPYLVDELIASIREKANQPVIAVGHSLGGGLSLLAAIKEPALFKAVIMLDAPLMSRFKSFAIYLAKQFGFIDKITPAKFAKRRKSHWQSFAELKPYFQSKALFKNFRTECVDDYINCGFVKEGEGCTLRFKKGIEYSIFRTLPHNCYHLENQLKVKAALIYGEDSRVLNLFDRYYMKKYFSIKSVKIKGGHMFPMEHPELAAQEIHRLLNAIL